MKIITQPGKDFDLFFNWLATKQYIGLDTETTGLSPLTERVLLIQIGDPGEQWVFDVYRLQTEIFKVLEAINNSGITKVMHHAKFDYGMIKTNFEIELNNIACTMLANQLLIAGKRNISSSLVACVEKYLGVKLDKSSRKRFAEKKFGSTFTKDELEYAGNDVQYLLPLLQEEQKLLSGRDMNDLTQLEFETVKVTSEMEIEGIHINKTKWLKLKTIAQENILQARQNLDAFFTDFKGKDLFGQILINYDSPKQIKPVLEKIIGCTLKSTSIDDLKIVDHDVIEALLEYRKWQKRLTTYGESFLQQHLDVDHKIHTQFNQLGAATGRYSSENPNLQNIPKEQQYREPFDSGSKNYKIISTDFAQQELRLLAYLSQEPAFLKALEEGYDLHGYSATVLYGIPIDKFFDEKKNIREEYALLRAKIKEINFGTIYGLGYKRLAKKLAIPEMEAKDTLYKYFKTFGRINSYLREVSDFARDNHYALSPLDKRRRDLTSFDWDDKKQAAHAINISKNMPFQGRIGT